MQQRTRFKIRMILVLTTVAALAGAGFGLVVAGASADTGTPDYGLGIARGLWTGTSIALPVALWEVLYVNERRGMWLRQLPFTWHLLIRTLFYLAVILIAIWMAAGLFDSSEDAGLGLNPDTLTQLGFSFVAALTANFAMMLNRLLGQSVFRDFLTGRYHKPKIEHRVLLFVDVAGSTSLAEEIGDTAFHLYLNEVYRRLSVPVIERRGRIHKYVGDEMIVSWIDSPRSRTAALRCGLDMLAVLDRDRGWFEQRFGTSRTIRCGLHAGPVVVGEMGDVRQEIVYLGDAMNLTARLVDLCREHQRSMLVSHAVLKDADAEEFAMVEPLGNTDIRGHRAPIAIAALSRREMP